ncbi:MAG: hypothetical protein Q4G34_09815 [Micrococcus sp.]|nr:hypothetical protein [Micrococcus sp.]
MNDRIPSPESSRPSRFPPVPSADILASETAEVTGPRRHPSGRTEQLFGVRRHDVVTPGPVPGVTVSERAEESPAGVLQAFNPAAWQPGAFTRGLDGRPTAAAATVILDNATAVAVHHAARGQWPAVVTTELQVNVLRPLDLDDTALMECWYTPLHVDGLGGAGRAWLVDHQGHVVVEATGWFQSVPAAPPAAMDAFVENAAMELGADTQRPMAQLLGLDPDSVLSEDSEVRPEVAAQAQQTARYERCPQLANPQGAMHGGAMTLRAVLAAQGALPDRARYDIQALRTLFLRPGLGEMVAMTRVRHAGRSLRLVDVELVPLDEAGAPVTHKPMVQVSVTFRARPEA